MGEHLMEAILRKIFRKICNKMPDAADVIKIYKWEAEISTGSISARTAADLYIRARGDSSIAPPAMNRGTWRNF